MFEFVIIIIKFLSRNNQICSTELVFPIKDDNLNQKAESIGVKLIITGYYSIQPFSYLNKKPQQILQSIY